MKKILFSAYNLDVGGIETALVSLLNNLDDSKYKITLVLEEKTGAFLECLNRNINVIEYTPATNKNIIVRKIRNLVKRIKFAFKHGNKYDFSASFATYSKMGAYVAQTASRNSYLWGHADYKVLYNNDMNKFKEMFDALNINKFKGFVFVANSAKESFLDLYPKYTDNTIVCNNMIDYKEIIKKSNEEANLKENKNVFTFLNVGRHDEVQKKLVRIIEASKKLKDEKYSFRVLFVGSGKDTDIYEKKITENNLNNTVLLLGMKKNPYPFFKIADSLILSSDYEGYPVVFIEAMILDIPIITTDISDAKTDIDGKFGIVTKKTTESIYLAMKQMMGEKFIKKEEFNPEKYNKDILEKIENLF